MLCYSNDLTTTDSQTSPLTDLSTLICSK